MSLCTRCDRLDLKQFTRQRRVYPWDIETLDITHLESMWHLNESSAECSLCTLLLNAFEKGSPRSNPWKIPVESDERLPIILRGVSSVDQYSNIGGFEKIAARCGNRLAYVGVYTNEADTIKVPESMVAEKAIKPAERRFSMMSEWIHRCGTTHSHCSGPPGKLPTRVIDVGLKDGDVAVLKTHLVERAHYVTLSHCWGKHPLIRTTQATLEAHLHALPALPKTFADAITITRELGIRYIWIDSLCIIQDDAQDWEREAAQMGRLYASSYLTIAASAAVDSSRGCFLPRDTTEHPKIKCTLPGGRVGHVYIRHPPTTVQDLDECVLQTRAWVLQERLLSRRTIHFSTDQIFWECKIMVIAESGGSDTHYRTSNDFGFTGAHESSARRLPTGDNSSTPLSLMFGSDDHENLIDKPPAHRSTMVPSQDEKRHFLQEWHDVLRLYTLRNLTNGTDKLPALSGLADAMGKKLGTRYIAGLWEEYLHYGLLWVRHLTVAKLTQPLIWRAPSWTWAAFDGAIDTFDQDLFNPADPPPPKSAGIHFQMLSNIQVDIDLAGTDPHGKLKSAVLTATGKIKKLSSRVDPTSEDYVPYHDAHFTRTEYLWDGEENVGDVQWDGEFIFNEVQPELWALQVTESRSTLSYDPGYLQVVCHCLILEFVGEGNIFSRVGRGTTGRVGSDRVRRNIGWFDDTDRKEIRII